MRIYKYLILALLLLPILANGAQRTLQYKPNAQGYFVSENGKNLYTRAIYGIHSLWRLETSDVPIFAAYHKTDNRNINFSINVNGRGTRLDSIARCTSMYRGGERIYKLSDPSWGKGSVTMTVVALPDQEGAIWQIQAEAMPKGSAITARCCETVPVKLWRSGDLGVDSVNCFAPDPTKAVLSSCTMSINGKSAVKYVMYTDRTLTSDDQPRLQQIYDTAQAEREAMASRIIIETPDDYINTLGPTLTMAGDAIWDGTSYQHGAVGWRMPLTGWRGAYAGDFLGWHDRARQHFDGYAASQVTDVAPTLTHPAQDPDQRMARAVKTWGTPMYSNGYICRNPGRNDQMHHYDMNLCYIDELLWHLQWTGDLEYARKVWPVIKSSLEWEKRNFDPDDDGLYDAYCCIWASDALYYNSAGVTHSTAYNYRANCLAALIAEKLGEDPTPYRQEADKIRSEVNYSLWLDNKGVWAESRDMMGNKLVHDHPGVWTVYHAIDGMLATPLQAYTATTYVLNNIPRIPIDAEGLDGDYAVIATTDWMPYTWSINNVAFAEMYHMALAMWQAGRHDKAYNLMKSAMLDGMFLGNSPGNIGQLSYYDAARGECYRDFADPIGVLSRTVIQGLFGFSPDALNHRVELRPGWPVTWEKAKITHPDFALDFKRDNVNDTYIFDLNIGTIDKMELILEAHREKVKSVTVNGEPAKWYVDSMSVGRPNIRVLAPVTAHNEILIEWDGGLISKERPVRANFFEACRPIQQGDMKWRVETLRSTAYNPRYQPEDMGIYMFRSASRQYDPVPLDSFYNANITDIFNNCYASPRSPYTTLQIPVQGIGDWCSTSATAVIDDSALRKANGKFMVEGIPYHTPAQGNNVVFTSLFDNYPNTVTIPLSGKARGINLMLAGSTNHMQCHVENARIEVVYADGSSETLKLIPPFNWCPIEQDYYVDGHAFKNNDLHPLRVTLKDGVASTDLGDALNITGVSPRKIDGGAAVMLGISLDSAKELKELRFTTIANDVVAGIIAATYVK